VLLVLFYLQSFGTVTAGAYKGHHSFNNFFPPSVTMASSGSSLPSLSI